MTSSLACSASWRSSFSLLDPVEGQGPLLREPQVASREDLEGYGFTADEDEAETESEKG